MDQPTMTVEIDEAIKRDPALLADVEAATRYLDTLHEWTMPPRFIRWKLASDQPERAEHRPAVDIMLGDWPDYESGVVSRTLSRVRSRSRDMRDQATRQLWTKLLQSRSKVIHDRVEAAISRIGSEVGDVD